MVQEFNKGVYDYIIASDENSVKGEQDLDKSEDEGAAEDERRGEKKEDDEEECK